jgi:hypothetical protein
MTQQAIQLQIGIDVIYEMIQFLAIVIHSCSEFIIDPKSSLFASSKS